MKRINSGSVFTFFALLAALLVSGRSFGQYGYGGYGRGGMYGGGMGRSMGAGQTSGLSPAIPNIAGDLANKETKWLKENLNLTKEQLKDVKKLNNDYGSQQQDAIKDIVGKGGGRPSPEAIKQIQDMMMMLNEEKEDQLKTLLTPEQWTLYQSKKEEMQKAVGGFRPPAKGVAAPPASTTTP
ncbi:hypothetical protein [Spirosoma pomorum]